VILEFASSTLPTDGSLIVVGRTVAGLSEMPMGPSNVAVVAILSIAGIIDKIIYS
jgi:hypothetical protein